jgi:ribosomal protein S27E
VKEQDDVTHEKNDVPRTADQALERLMEELPTDTLLAVRDADPTELCLFHFGLGTWIRNHFGLWKGNMELVRDVGAHEPDGASSALLKRLQKHLADWEPPRNPDGSLAGRSRSNQEYLEDVHRGEFARVDRVRIQRASARIIAQVAHLPPRNHYFDARCAWCGHEGEVVRSPQDEILCSPCYFKRPTRMPGTCEDCGVDGDWLYDGEGCVLRCSDCTTAYLRSLP